jgi:hypothetical protein
LFSTQHCFFHLLLSFKQVLGTAFIVFNAFAKTGDFGLYFIFVLQGSLVTSETDGGSCGCLLFDSCGLDHLKLAAEFSQHVFSFSVFLLSLAGATQQTGNDALVFAEKTGVELAVAADLHLQVIVQVLQFVALSALLGQVVFQGLAGPFQIFDDLLETRDVLAVCEFAVFVGSDEGGEALLVLEGVDLFEFCVLFSEDVVEVGDFAFEVVVLLAKF